MSRRISSRSLTGPALLIALAVAVSPGFLTDAKSATAFGGALAAPTAAYLYDLEHAASRPVAVDEGTRILQGVSAAAGAGDLHLSGIMAQMERIKVMTKWLREQPRRTPLGDLNAHCSTD